MSATRCLAKDGFRGQNHLVKVARSAIARPVPSNINKLIRFGNVNASSLQNKTEVFIDHVIGESIDVCVVTETWLKDNDSVTLAALTPTGFSFCNVNRHSGSSGGGTGVIFRNSFKVWGADGTHRESLEASEWNFTAHGKTTKFIVVYQPPYSEAHPVTPSAFFREFALYGKCGSLSGNSSHRW